MNILITGGCGFIGLNLLEAIVKVSDTFHVRVLDNLSVGTEADLASITEYTRLDTAHVGAWPSNRVELVKGDVRDLDTMMAVCCGMDAVVHLAANTGVIPSIEDPLEDCRTNVLGTLNSLEAARLNSVRRFVFASSGAPLGRQEPPIHENMVPRPISPYGAGKLSGEGYCSAYHGSYGLGTVALRFGNVYGPHSLHKGSVVALFIRNLLYGEPLTIYGDGRQTRDFIYSRDLVKAILLALEMPGVEGGIFQIATHREHTVLEIATALKQLSRKHLGRESRIVNEKARTGEVIRNYSDITRAREMLGFEPQHSIQDGLEKTFLWFISGRNAEQDQFKTAAEI